MELLRFRVNTGQRGKAGGPECVTYLQLKRTTGRGGSVSGYARKPLTQADHTPYPLRGTLYTIAIQWSE